MRAAGPEGSAQVGGQRVGGEVLGGVPSGPLVITAVLSPLGESEDRVGRSRLKDRGWKGAIQGPLTFTVRRAAWWWTVSPPSPPHSVQTRW